MWEAELVEGAVAERTATDGSLLHAIRGIVETGIRPDGSSINLDMEGVGNMPSGQRFIGGTDADLVSGAQRMLASFNLTAVQVRVLHPLGPALYIVATVPTTDVLSSGQLSTLNRALNPDRPCCEGFYLELRTPDGQVAVRVANSRRSGSGTYWTRPGLDNIKIGIAHL